MSSSVLVLTVIGLGLIVLVGLLLCLEGVSVMRGLGYQREHRQLSLDLLGEKIKAVQALQIHNEVERFAWNGFRKFTVDRKFLEADGTCSFYLVPHDGKPLPDYKPGQFLTFRLQIPGHEKPVVRCYSLSDAASATHWRVTIKQVPAPADQPEAAPGLVSSYFHSEVKKGDILDVKTPCGGFVLDPQKKKPAVLLAGGIGITPLLSMASVVARQGTNRDIWLFYGVRHRGEHAFFEQIRQLSIDHPNIHTIICYSRPGKEDRQGEHYDHAGRVSVDVLKRYLDSNNFEFYVCGPPDMMESLTRQIAAWGVAKSDIHTEAFGPASVKARQHAVADKPPTESASECKIKFAKCGKEFVWNPQAENILEFSESKGIALEGGCRAGNCGTCEIAALGRTARTATLIALTECRLLEVRWQGLRSLLRKDSGFKALVEQRFLENALRSFLLGSPIFRHLKDDDIALKELLSRTRLETYGEYDTAGTFKELVTDSAANDLADEPVIATEGDNPEGLIMVRSGLARMSRREEQGQVAINDTTCIGCGTCSNNCPYDAIRMVEIRNLDGTFLRDSVTHLPISKATKCDLCVDQWGGPACQRACPHDALVRIDMRDVEGLAQWNSR